MKETFSKNEQFTFHSSWITAMGYIASKAVRNRLMASIIEYGLNSRHVPVRNSTADAILSIAMDQIDRESGRKTRREEYAERVQSSREEESAEKSVEKSDEKPDEVSVEKAVGSADDGLGDAGGGEETVTETESDTKSETGEEPEPEQKAASIHQPEKKPLEDYAAVGECMTDRTDSPVRTDRPARTDRPDGTDRIVNGRSYRVVKQNNETISKKNSVRPHRWRHR